MVRISLALGFLPLVSALVFPRQEKNATEIYKFPTTASIEGIGVRSNGNILISRLDSADIFEISPTAKTAVKVATLPGVNAAAAMVEMAPDVFYVVAGSLSNRAGGGWGIYKVDLNLSPPVASAFKVIKEGLIFNGLTKFDNDTLLIGDSQAGSIFKLSVSTGEYSQVITADPSMVPPAGGTFGLDGIRFYNGVLYFTNITKRTFNKVAISISGKPGAVQEVLTATTADDLSFDASGNAYLAAPRDGGVIKVDPAGKVTKLVGFTGPTCTIFGRSDATKNTLYIGGGTTVGSFVVSV